MLLILDTNILFSFFNKSKVFSLTKELRHIGYKLVSPDFVFFEIKGLKKQIIESSGLSESEYEFLLLLIKRIIRFIPKSEYKEFILEAKTLSPHFKDFPLFALSLYLNKSPIWSREVRLKKQESIKVLSDEDIEKLLRKE